MIVALYARVSTNDQDELLQLPRLREYAARLGHEVYSEYTDKASGRNGNRPEWQRLLSDARRHEFDAVIVVKLDRIMRSLVQLLGVLEEFQKRKIDIITLDQGLIDLSSANSRLLVQFMGMIAEWERQINSERTKEALAEKKAQGVKLGRPKSELPVHTIALHRIAGKSWSDTSKILGIPRTTIMSNRKIVENEIKRIVETQERVG